VKKRYWKAFGRRNVPVLTAKPSGRPPKSRRVYNLLSCGTDTSFGVHNSSLTNTMRGLIERVYLVNTSGDFAPPVKPMKALFESRMQEFKSALMKECAFTGGFRQISRQEFVDCYRGRRRTLYQNAADSLEVQPIRRKDADLKTFVKAEKINFTAKGDPAPRVIQPRDPRYNVEVGRYLKKVEHTIYRAIAAVMKRYSCEGWNVTVNKGLNARETAELIVGKFRKYRRPVAIGLDASRFDQHVSDVALRWEHSVYNGLFNDPYLAKLLTWQVRNRGHAYCLDGKIKYEVLGCRMSGDMNTALGNCLLMCGMVYSYMRTKGVKYDLVNNGDDCVLILESSGIKLLDDLPSWFSQMGFTMKVETPVFEIEHIEFCQAQPCYDGHHWVMVRNPLVCLAKDLITVKNVSDIKSWNRARNSIGLCGQALAGNIPVYGEFYKLLTRDAGDKIFNDELSSGMQFMSLRMNQIGRVHYLARVSFYNAFGILPDMQVEMEKEYATFKPQWQSPIPVDKHFTTIYQSKYITND
jgi:hypothetical protein